MNGKNILEIAKKVVIPVALMAFGAFEAWSEYQKDQEFQSMKNRLDKLESGSEES